MKFTKGMSTLLITFLCVISFVVSTLFSGNLVGNLASADEKENEDENIYSPTGKRDPFRPAFIRKSDRDLANVSELERFSLEQYSLRAVLRTSSRASAMFEDPDGKTHILEEGMILGRERAVVSRILEKEVIMTIQTKNYLGTERPYEKHLSLPEK